MAFTVSANVQGQPVLQTVNLTGDEISIRTAIAGGATEITNIGVVPNNVVEVVVMSDVDITVDCGSNSASTITGGVPMVWATGCGLTAPFAGSSVTQFTIVNQEAEVAGTVDIMVKTADS